MNKLNQLKQSLQEYADESFETLESRRDQFTSALKEEYDHYNILWNINELPKNIEERALFNTLRGKEVIINGLPRSKERDFIYRVKGSDNGFVVQVQQQANAWWNDLSELAATKHLGNAYKYMILRQNIHLPKEEVFASNLQLEVSKSNYKAGFSLTANSIKFDRCIFNFELAWNEHSEFCTTYEEAIATFYRWLNVKHAAITEAISSIS